MSAAVWVMGLAMVSPSMVVLSLYEESPSPEH